MSTSGVIDSLLTLLKTDKEDTAKITHLNNLGWELQFQNPDTSIILGNQALAFAEKLQWKKGIANSYGQLGAYNYLKADYPKALDYNLKALKIDEELNNKKGIANRLGSIGVVYTAQGNYPKALDYYFKALKMDEELSDKKGMAMRLANIGVVYNDQGNLPKTLDYYFKALKIFEELGDKKRITAVLGNIGGAYQEQGNYPMALDYDFRALKMAEEVGNKNYIGIWLSNIGVVYYKQGDYPGTKPAERNQTFGWALNYFFKALKISEELGDKNSIAINLGNIGSLYTKAPSLPPPPISSIRAMEQGGTGGEGKKGFALAEQYLLRSLSIATEIGSLEHIQEGHKNLSELYDQLAAAPSTQGQLAKKVEYIQKALDHYKQYTMAKDSLFNMEKEKDITRKEMNYEFDKKEAAAQAEHQIQIAVAEADKKRQNIIIWSIAIGLLIVAVFSVVIFNRLRVTRKQKRIIDEKNKHITDSINYAKRIQEAIIPSQEEVSKHFSDYFIFLRPREIVSGDFYWLSHQNGKTIFAVADCTGHGVPGAFMSMIGNTLLNEIVNEKNICEPNEILNHLNEGIVRALHQESRSQDDGMDVSVCLFDKEKNKITFAGANHSLYMAGNGSMEEIKGDIYSIGGVFGNKTVSFSQKEFYLNKNSTLYFSTDGFSDQTGGANGRKFLVKQLRDLLAGVSSLGIKEQEEKITMAFEQWKGNRAQLDDVLLVGIKI